MIKVVKSAAIIIGVLAMVWTVLALNVSWKETDRMAKLAEEQHTLLIKEQEKSRLLLSELNACSESKGQ